MDEGPRGWAAPLYERVLDAARIGPGTRVLDVGCGAGGFAGAAVARGAVVHGVDADPAAVASAAAQVPGATFAVGDAHDPAAPGPVDVVAAVQVLAHLRDPLRALRTAAAAAPVVALTAWGDERECDVRAFGEALAPWLGPRKVPPAPPPGAPDPLVALVERAGLVVAVDDRVVCPFHYPDEDELLAPLFDSGIGRHAVNRAGPAAVRAAVLERVERHRTADGGYRLDNAFRVLTAARAG